MRVSVTIALSIGMAVFWSIIPVHNLQAAPRRSRVTASLTAGAAPRIISIDDIIMLRTTMTTPYLLIDTDSAESYQREHIDGAVNIPLEQLAERHKVLPRDVLLITICHCGNEATRAKAAAEQLMSLGFKKVGYLGKPANAYNEYRRLGYPVAVDLTQYIAVGQLQPLLNLYSAAGTHLPLNPGNQPRKYTADQIFNRMNANPAELGTYFLIVDVREPDAFARGHIPGAVNMPLGTLFTQDAEGRYGFENIGKDKDVVFYTEEGDLASRFLAEMMRRTREYYSVGHLEGGLKAWLARGYLTEN
jgi:rhodanese-related sulfurtransferase